MRPPVRRVALDARHVADAPIEALRALWSRGFLLSIPMSTFCHWVSDAIDGSYEGHAPGRVLDRLLDLRSVLDDRWPILPGIGTLRRVLGGTGKRGRRIRAQESDRLGQWFSHATYEICSLDGSRRVAEHARRWLRAEAEHEGELAEVAVARSPSPRPADEFEAVEAVELRKHWIGNRVGLRGPRSDALLSVLALRAARGASESGTIVVPSVLASVAWPAILATPDIELFRDLDDSGTYQRPWVRTLGELATDPPWLETPWGGGARRDARRCVFAGSYGDLARRDEEVLASFRERRFD